MLEAYEFPAAESNRGWLALAAYAAPQGVVGVTPARRRDRPASVVGTLAEDGMYEAELDHCARILRQQSFVKLDARFCSAALAGRAADLIVSAAAHAEDAQALEVVGEFVVPPSDGPASRAFQTLHFDFGLPLHPTAPRDIALYTALHVPPDRGASTALTRLVDLVALLGQRRWPSPTELVRRFRSYGTSHGTADMAAGYTEGSLARVIEAADGAPPVLPSLAADPSFLCGTEFQTLEQEETFLHTRGLDLAPAVTEVMVKPGQLLLFDNLSLAHGRRGSRAPGELMQRIYGRRRLSVEAQRQVRARLLAGFAGSAQAAAAVV